MNILILRVSAIGDVVHTLPAITLLKELYPNAKISWIVQRKAASLLLNQPFLENVWILPDKFLKRHNLITTIRTIREVRRVKWDAIFDFQGILKTSLLLPFLSGDKYGFDSKNARLSFSSYFTHHHTTPSFVNIIQKNLALASNMHFRKKARSLGAQSSHYDMASPSTSTLAVRNTFLIPETNKEIVDAWLLEKNITSFIALAPNTTWESKHWPLEYWKVLLTKLPSVCNNHNIVLLGQFFGKHADALALHAKKHTLSLLSAPRWDLITTARAIQRASLLIGPDTGLLHLADFLGTQTIGIFGPTLAAKHGPFLSTRNIKAAIQIPCNHSYQKYHGSKGTYAQNCMWRLSPEELCNNVKNILKTSIQN